MRQHDQGLGGLVELAGKKENFTEVVNEDIKESGRRKVVAALRQFIEVDKTLVSV